MQANLRPVYARIARRTSAPAIHAHGSFPRVVSCNLHPPTNLTSLHTHTKSLAHIRGGNEPLSTTYFSAAKLHLKDDSNPAHPSACSADPKPDERTLKLGKTISILHERLPTLLASPLPSEIISPQITLHLFPTTHPHLPNASGRYAYHAALWTAPVAWGRVPVIGNIKLEILSERMVKNGCASTASNNFRNEKLIVKWKTCGKSSDNANPLQVIKLNELFGKPAKDDSEFSGLFIFEFDEDGRIVTHTIEHAQQGGNWEKMSRFVSVTDWLIGLAKNRGKAQEPGYALGYCEAEQRHDLRRRLQKNDE